VPWVRSRNYDTPIQDREKYPASDPAGKSIDRIKRQLSSSAAAFYFFPPMAEGWAQD
jgi:hypothetical protein